MEEVEKKKKKEEAEEEADREQRNFRAQELCESRGGRPGLPVLNTPMVSVDVKQHLKKKILKQSSGAV